MRLQTPRHALQQVALSHATAPSRQEVAPEQQVAPQHRRKQAEIPLTYLSTSSPIKPSAAGGRPSPGSPGSIRRRDPFAQTKQLPR